MGQSKNNRITDRKDKFGHQRTIFTSEQEQYASPIVPWRARADLQSELVSEGNVRCRKNIHTLVCACWNTFNGILATTFGQRSFIKTAATRPNRIPKSTKFGVGEFRSSLHLLGMTLEKTQVDGALLHLQALFQGAG